MAENNLDAEIAKCEGGEGKQGEKTKENGERACSGCENYNY